MAELRASAAALGVARVEHLGYADSGLGPEVAPDPPGRDRFVRADVEEAAERLAAILREEHVDVLLHYEPNGGYGHPDHEQVHRVGRRAAELAGTPKVLEATVPRDTICRAIDLAAKVYRFPPEFDRVELRPRLLGPQRDHPPHQRAPAHRAPSAPRCAPTPRRRPPTAAPTAPWPPSCASRARSTTSSSGASGSSTARPARVTRSAATSSTASPDPGRGLSTRPHPQNMAPRRGRTRRTWPLDASAPAERGLSTV